MVGSAEGHWSWKLTDSIFQMQGFVVGGVVELVSDGQLFREK